MDFFFLCVCVQLLGHAVLELHAGPLTPSRCEQTRVDPASAEQWGGMGGMGALLHWKCILLQGRHVSPSPESSETILDWVGI